MTGMRMAPIAKVVATLEPDTAAKIMQVITQLIASPPCTPPTSERAKCTSRSEMPPASIRLPERDKAAAVERNMGSALANRAVPSRWLIDTLGIEGTAAGTDNQVNILNPFVGLYVMVSRKDPTGKVYGADQALTREEALRLYTNAGPYYTFDERTKGAIEVGRLADMVVLSGDYMTVPEAQIKDIKPMQTIVNGKVVYAAAE